MKFEELLCVVGEEPVFETGLLLAGRVDPAHVRQQMTRWVQSKRVYQLRRGLYSLAPPFRRTKPHPYLVANRMVRASYVSCQSALAHYGLIPEHVQVVVSVTTGRPARWENQLGVFVFRHIKPDFWRAFQLLSFSEDQSAFVATPEKALLDLAYLQPRADSMDYLRELRLQNLDRLSIEELTHLAQVSRRPKLERAAGHIKELAETESLEYETLAP